MNILRFKQFKNSSIYEGKTYIEPVNEGIGKFFKNLWDKVVAGPLKKLSGTDSYVGQGSWLANLKTMQDKKVLPGSIKVYTWGKLATDVEEVSPEDAGIDNGEAAQHGYAITESIKINEGEDYVQLKAYKDMPNVDAKELVETISDAYLTKGNLMIWGAPGIGKTEILKQVAKSHKANVIVVILSLMEPTDAIGLPEIIDINAGTDKPEERRTITRLPIWYPQDNFGIDGIEGKGGIMFLDEINRANKAVMNSLLTLVQDRKLDIAGYELPSEWVVIAAANREEDDPGNLEEIGSALGNRFQHVNYTPKTEDWIEWASRKDDQGAFNVIDDIIGFIQFNKDFLHQLDPEAASELWASPRSWTVASRQIEKTKVIRKSQNRVFNEQDMERIIARNVSPTIAKEFMEYVKVARQYPLDQVALAYSQPMKAPVPNTKTGMGRVDTSLALLAAVAFVKKEEDCTLDEYLNLIKYLGRIKRKELVLPFLKFFNEITKNKFKDPDVLARDDVSDFFNSFNS